MAYVICAEWKSDHESKTVPFALCYASSGRHIWTSDSNAALGFNSADEAEAWWHEHFNEMTAHEQHVICYSFCSVICYYKCSG